VQGNRATLNIVVYECSYAKKIERKLYNVALQIHTLTFKLTKTVTTLCLRKKTHPFYFCDVFVRYHPILPHTTGNFKKKHVHCPAHLALSPVQSGDYSRSRRFWRQSIHTVATE